ncbi:GntR family transcriptional regulator [uncultured Ruminococcus sp.]|uniref:GntR family transcriptional regulator n=1 Tax=uncultured Ruminococcus sp. TaxID=165186 RepID=UPI0026012432|nr:GntR family transcriptional regulator [uncultured Ruminococcus sp.]
MEFNPDNEKPIYQQLAEWLSDLIIEGTVNEGEQIPSTTEISINYKINPATALKGINILVDKNIVYKKRGVGMFVCDGAVSILKRERRHDFQQNTVKALTHEAKRLGISKDEIIAMIERSFGE